MPHRATPCQGGNSDLRKGSTCLKALTTADSDTKGGARFERPRHARARSGRPAARCAERVNRSRGKLRHQLVNERMPAGLRGAVRAEEGRSATLQNPRRAESSHPCATRNRRTQHLSGRRSFPGQARRLGAQVRHGSTGPTLGSGRCGVMRHTLDMGRQFCALTPARVALNRECRAPRGRADPVQAGGVAVRHRETRDTAHPASCPRHALAASRVGH
jgi:hypothetical protein